MMSTNADKPGRAAHLNLIAALLATFIGILALAVSIYAVHWQRQAVRAQVWPMVQWSTSDTGGFFVRVENAGVGPAQMRSVKIAVDGKPVKRWNDALRLLLGDRADGDYTTSYLHDRVVGAGQSVEALAIKDAKLAGLVAKERARLDIEICYCSVLGECWNSNDEASNACPPNPTPFEN